MKQFNLAEWQSYTVRSIVSLAENLQKAQHPHDRDGWELDVVTTIFQRSYELTIKGWRSTDHKMQEFHKIWNNWRSLHGFHLYGRSDDGYFTIDPERRMLVMTINWENDKMIFDPLNQDSLMFDFLCYLDKWEKQHRWNKAMKIRLAVGNPIENYNSIGFVVTVSNTNTGTDAMKRCINQFHWKKVQPEVAAISSYKDAGGCPAITFVLEWSKPAFYRLKQPPMPSDGVDLHVSGGRSSGKTNKELLEKVRKLESRVKDLEMQQMFAGGSDGVAIDNPWSNFPYKDNKDSEQ